MADPIKKKTGEDIDVQINLVLAAYPDLTPLTQIIVVFYYKRNSQKKKFSFHALDENDAALVAEAALEGRTVHNLPFAAPQALNAVIPVADTDEIAVPNTSVLRVFAEISYFEPGGEKRKIAVDPVIVDMEKSAVEGLI